LFLYLLSSAVDGQLQSENEYKTPVTKQAQGQRKQTRLTEWLRFFFTFKQQFPQTSINLQFVLAP
jgi:hypothetical protein